MTRFLGNKTRGKLQVSLVFSSSSMPRATPSASPSVDRGTGRTRRAERDAAKLQPGGGRIGALLDQFDRESLGLLVGVVLHHLDAVHHCPDRTDQVVADARAQERRKIEGFEGNGARHGMVSGGDKPRPATQRVETGWRGDTPQPKGLPIRRSARKAEPVTKEKTADVRLAEDLTGIAIRASAAILTVDFRDAGTRLKADNSAVTRADEAAHAVICSDLARLVPGIPVISEEAAAEWQGREPPAEFLLVDPLDGTVEFLAGRLEYTVNIALVRSGTPVVGVVAAPALGLIWRGAAGHGADRLGFADGKAATPETIRTRRWPKDERVAAVSRSHFDAISAAFLQRIAPVTEVSYGSALKFARIAEGAVDVYPRLAPTSEWDIAAGHALILSAGGAVVAPGGGSLRYGRWHVGFRVEGFTAWGDAEAAKKFVA